MIRPNLKNSISRKFGSVQKRCFIVEFSTVKKCLGVVATTPSKVALEMNIKIVS